MISDRVFRATIYDIFLFIYLFIIIDLFIYYFLKGYASFNFPKYHIHVFASLYVTHIFYPKYVVHIFVSIYERRKW